MAKVAILLPDAEMISIALRAAEAYHLDVSTVSIATLENIDEIISLLESNGTDIIITRGGFVLDYRQRTTIPVVDIKVTVSELDQMVKKARLMSSKDMPQIALVGTKNMFSSVPVAFFEETYGIVFKVYLTDLKEEKTSSIKQAIADGADVLIGGKDVCEYGQKAGVSALHAFSGEESVMDACRIVGLLCGALDREKQHSASLEMIFNRMPNGEIHIDSKGVILHANQFVEHLLTTDAAHLRGAPIQRFIPGLKDSALRDALERGREIRTTVTIDESRFQIGISPILVADQVVSAILSFYEMAAVRPEEESYAGKLRAMGFCATRTFDGFVARSEVMAELVEKAKHFATFPFPVLILGPEGTEKALLAECIHNASDFSDAPFIRLDCGGHDGDGFLEALRQGGEATASFLHTDFPVTLYLHGVEQLTREEQKKLFVFMQLHAADSEASGYRKRRGSIRVLASATTELTSLAANGSFDRALFELLSLMTLEVPPLCQRRKDIMGWADFYISSLQSTLGRYLKLTLDAQNFMTAYDWPGNIGELKALCRRIFIYCSKYNVNAADVQALLTGAPLQEQLPLTADRQAERLTEALHRYGGDRKATAKALGISTTTLWRQMKRFHIAKGEGKAVAPGALQGSGQAGL